MPPLREHKEDIPAITEAILHDMNLKHDRHVTGIDDEMLSRLLMYEWPGNVRELRNTIERAVILCGEGYLSARDLPPGFGSRSVLPTPEPSPNAVQVEVGTTVDEAERRLILKTLESTQNNKTRAAEILGISLKTMHNKLKEYGAASAAGSPGGSDAPEEYANSWPIRSGPPNGAPGCDSYPTSASRRSPLRRTIYRVTNPETRVNCCGKDSSPPNAAEDQTRAGHHRTCLHPGYRPLRALPQPAPAPAGRASLHIQRYPRPSNSLCHPQRSGRRGQ